jgi:phosphoenolpyruvate synthase/pyruvate phosphate dikinase
MKELKPKDYDYLWTDYDVNFIFTSCYLFKKFRNTDIVLIYDYKEKGLHFFLSKKDRKKFSKLGINFYEKMFPSWESNINKNIELGRKLIKITKQDKPHSLSIKELKERFIERVNLFQALGENYFYTEFFFLDRVEKIKKSTNLSKHLKRMGDIKLKAREVLNEFYNYNRLFKLYISELSSRTGRKDLPWLSFKEIIAITKGKKIEISDRDKTNWILTKHNGWKLIKSKEAEKIKYNFEKYFFKTEVNELKGIIANKGVYRGIVKKIRTVFSDDIQKEISKVNPGDVLVANTTGPELTNVCKIARAIITDEGGITSHAAIISRELNIPCIIGTKIATKVLKDGDLVEVDANKGIVRKLK